MISKALNSPPASSAGRLFDAVAAALGYCREQAGFEGHAAIKLEAAATPFMDQERDSAYGYRWQNGTLSWEPLWQELLADLAKGIEAGRIAARFHHGLSEAVSRVGLGLAETHDIATIGLNGGVWQNRLLLEATFQRLRESGLKVITPSIVPANDGGLALGQVVVEGR